ncbi:DNA cytosine methyltransferase [Paraburkholderia phytofirmans]|uniref:DNA cytosine methyltransferase n=1 Tax=Paraburkholderia phytofirmans TaxID=261302 RepID=UPI0038BC1607
MKRDAISLSLDLGSELIIDNFAGGGGASEGMEQAFGRSVDIAINHDGEALAMHAANHPGTKHYCEDVFQVDPIEATKNQPVGLVWLSPDCKHHSKAKGGKPVDKKIRGLAWIGRKWAGKSMPRALMLENVEEIQSWTGLVAKRDKATGRVVKLDGSVAQPGEQVPVREQHLVANPKTKGSHFRKFVRSLEDMGYRVEHRELRACDYGAPTIRKRLYLIARRDHLPIVWPAPTHGDPKSAAVQAGKLKPWRTAAECIDWSIPCPSIFERERPLKDATLSRIAKGIMKFVVNSADPFIVKFSENSTGQETDEPLHTVMAGAPRFGVVAPTLMHVTHQGTDRNANVNAPMATVTGANRGEQALLTAHITKMRTGSVGSDLGNPLHTVTAGGKQARPGTGNAMGIIAATLVKQNFGDAPHQSVEAPLHTVTTQGNRFGVVSATLIQTGYGERAGQAPRVPGLDKPLGTAVAGGVKHAVVSAFLAKHYGGVVGTGVDVPTGTVTTSDHHSVVTAQLVGCGGRAGQSRPRDAGEPMATITAKADTTVVTSHLLKLRNNQFGQDAREPIPTLTAGGGHVGEVRAFLIKYYGNDKDGANLRSPLGTIPTHDRFGLVTIHGEDYVIVDIGMRMLTPRELATAQGFPFTYILDPIVNGKPLSKSAQVRMIGNSVCPDVATALILANFAHEKQMAGAAA